MSSAHLLFRVEGVTWSRLYLGTRCIPGDKRLWVGDSSASSCLVSLPLSLSCLYSGLKTSPATTSSGHDPRKAGSSNQPRTVKGYLAHNNLHPPRTLP